MNLFNHEVNKRKLVNIAYGFDNFCRLIEEVYTPLIKDRNRINRIDVVEHLKEKLNEMHKIYEDPLGELAKFSENKFKRYSEGYEDYEDCTELINDSIDTVQGAIKIAMTKDSPWKFRKLRSDLDIMFWRRMSDSASKYDPATWDKIVSKMDDFLLDKVDKYYEIMNFLSSYNNYSYEISKIFWEKFDEQYKKEFKIEDYEKQKQEYKDKIKSIDKTLDMVIEEVHSLHQSSWEDVITFLIKDRWLSFKDIEGSSNKVLHVKSDLPVPHKSIVIKAGDKCSNSLILEKNLIEYINKNLTFNIVECYKRQSMRNIKKIYPPELGYNQFFRYPAFKPISINTDIKIKLPEVMFFSDKISKDYDWLALKEEYKNIELNQILDPKTKKECLNAITQFLAFIHATVPENASLKGKISLSDYVKEKLDKPCLGLKDRIKSDIYKSLTPILNSLSLAPYVFNKDSHPGNFITYEGKNQDYQKYYLITAIDWEDKGFRPLHLDLASLLECLDNLTYKEKKDHIQNYIRFFNTYNREEKFEKIEYDSNFKLAYSNAVIYYSIILSSVFSNPKMESFRQKRGNFLEKALYQINCIKREHKEYYNQYKNDYNLLEDVLKEAVLHFS